MKTILIILILFLFSTIAYNQSSKTSLPSGFKSNNQTINKTDSIGVISNNSSMILTDTIHVATKISAIEKLNVDISTYKDAVNILGKVEVKTSDENKVAPGSGRTNYLFNSKGIRIDTKNNKIIQISLYNKFKDTLSSGLYIGMNEFDAIKNCDSLYIVSAKYQYPSPQTSRYYYKTSNCLFTFTAENNVLIDMAWFKDGLLNVEKYGTKWGQLVDEHAIKIGMTADMVVDSWGKPDDINKTVGSWGVHEQWVYTNGKYLYFENGLLTSWQE